ncbi:hypothetical protein QP975_08340 [Corynebacterium mastitidis]|nr:hypothetical protein [Corynebacterium mastitidis]MDK8450979.1 hypothetical protein [Corynebacterium mastitidis]
MRAGYIDWDTGRELWPAEQCSGHCGVARSTWTTYVAREQAPTPVTRLHGTPLWDASEVRTWHAQRPSQQR